MVFAIIRPWPIQARSGERPEFFAVAALGFWRLEAVFDEVRFAVQSFLGPEAFN
jgi:hypothetical protein